MLATILPPTNDAIKGLQHQLEDFGEERSEDTRSIEQTCLPLPAAAHHQKVVPPSSITVTPHLRQQRSASRGGKLRDLNRLYGRSEEQQIVLNAYEEAIRGNKSNQANLVVVKGNAGVGKTAVAQSLKDKVINEDGGFFMTWKFDQETHFEGADGFTEAFTSLSKQIQDAGDEVVADIREAIRAAGPADAAVIANMMPMLAPIIGKVDSNANSNSVEASGRQLQIFNGLLRAISTKEHPLVVLFDDMQFSYSCAHTLLEECIPDAKNESILYMVTMGPEEPTQGTEKLLKNLQNSCNTTTVELGDLDETTTNLMVADILHVEEAVSAPMTTFLYYFTKGNPLFVIELLHLMFENRVLTYDEDSRTWNTDDERMKFICDCKDFEALIGSKLNRLQQPVKEMLKAAACLGTKIDINLLDIIMSAPVTKHMHFAVASGLVVAVDRANGAYRFATNGAREAAYSLIPEVEREAFHLAVGRKLLKSFSKERLHEQISTVIGQLKRGAKPMTNQKEKYAVASLCLQAAEKAVEWASFQAAADYIYFGISLLGDRCWREEYDLTLSIHNCAAEVGYAIGDFSPVQEHIEAVLKNARVFDHKLQALYVKISILSATAKLDESIDAGLEVLKQIGELITAHPSRTKVTREFVSHRRLMRNKSSDMLLRLPAMTDQYKAAAMQIINLISLPAIFARPLLMPLLVMRATRITTSYGLCAISSFVFGLYGMILVSVDGEIDEATRMGELALQLLDRFDSKQWLPRVHVAVYGCIYGWTKGVNACIEPLKRGYDVGIESGDIEYAMLNGTMRNTYIFCSGTPLPEVRKEMLVLTETLVEFKQESMLRLHNAMLHMIEAFMETDCNRAFSHLIEGEAVLLASSTTSSDLLYNCWYGFKKLILSYLMGDYAGAASEAMAMTDVDLLPVTTVDISMIVTFDALARIAYCKKTGKNKRKTMIIAKKRLKRMEKFSKINQSFCLGLTYFLKAEIAWLTGKHRSAPQLYFTCVSLFGRVNMLSLHAMAAERAGRYMLECGKMETAKDYFEEAVSVLDKWGAQGKSNALSKEISILFGTKKK